MYKFDRDLIDYLKELKHNDKALYKRIPKSEGYITPGKVLLLTYPEDGEEGALEYYRLVLVVSTLYGNGVKMSSLGNKQISCYRLNDSPTEVSSVILKTLYNNKRLCSYYTIQKSLLLVLGEIAFRTYNLDKIRDIQSLTIDKKRLPKS